MNLQRWIEQNFSIVLPILIPLFAVLGLGVGMLFGRTSGWFKLVAGFPDRDEAPVSQFSWQSGFMNRVRMNHILKLGVCPSGLRVGMIGLYRPFARDFFVPWQAIRATRKERLFVSTVELQFGNPVIGSLALSERTARQLVNAGARFVMPSS